MYFNEKSEERTHAIVHIKAFKGYYLWLGITCLQYIFFDVSGSWDVCVYIIGSEKN